MTVGYGGPCAPHPIPTIHSHKRKKWEETKASEKNQKVHQTNSRAVSLKVKWESCAYTAGRGLAAKGSGFSRPEHPQKLEGGAESLVKEKGGLSMVHKYTFEHASRLSYKSGLSSNKSG